ncbi:MAG: HAMP domain-containing histidine kinase [Bacteroidales bacterium]|jgi:signal transduction histidine kinase|nr:HAMP domain-containing histidine kinase [Bacteroidales bacterium]
MNFLKQLKSLAHSFIAKLIGLIILLAFAIILTVSLFKGFILSDKTTHLFIFLIVVIILIFSLAIYFVHRLLLPVRELNKGVKEISKGNLDVQLAVKSTDELGKLANAFNLMTKNLRLMVRYREQLLLDVSHELRTPLTRALLALEMADESEYITSAKRNLKEVQAMITELLENQRLKNGFDNLNISRISIKNLITRIAEEYSDVLPGVNINLISEGLFIEADEELMKIVLRNLLENALKHSPENSSPVELSVIDNDDRITVRIEDFGQGINPDEIEKVFEPFYRTDRSRSRKTGGYGLGLHLCKNIIETHNGEIKIYNKNEGYGLIVEIVIKRNWEHPSI